MMYSIIDTQSSTNDANITFEHEIIVMSYPSSHSVNVHPNISLANLIVKLNVKGLGLYTNVYVGNLFPENLNSFDVKRHKIYHYTAQLSRNF